MDDKNKKKKSPRKHVHATVYEILKYVLKLNRKYYTFNERIRHKRLCNVLQIHSHRGRGSHENEVKLVRNTDGSYCNQKLVASKYNIAYGIDMFFGSVATYIDFLCNDLNMVDFDSITNGYTINNKGMRFMEKWNQIEKLWPSSMSPYTKNNIL